MIAKSQEIYREKKSRVEQKMIKPTGVFSHIALTPV